MIYEATKKPVTVDVFHYESIEQLDEIAEWTGKGVVGTCINIGFPRDDRRQLTIDTLEGTMFVTEGSWIIKGVKGEFYACKPDIFDATYVLETEEPQQLIMEPLIKFEGTERNYNAYYINEDEYLGYIEDQSDLVSKVSFFPAIEIREFSIEAIIEIASFMKLLKDNPLKEIKTIQ